MKKILISLFILLSFNISALEIKSFPGTINSDLTINGATTVTSLTDGTATLLSGSLTGIVDIDASGTVTANLFDDGTMNITGGTITGASMSADQVSAAALNIGANAFTVNSIEIVGADGEVNKAAIEDYANWDTAYSDRLKWDGGNTGLTAATGRTSLALSSVDDVTFSTLNATDIISTTLTGTLQTAAQTNVTSLGALTTLQVDNLNLNTNTLSSTTGALNLTPVAGSAVVIDGKWSFDGVDINVLSGGYPTITPADVLTIISDNEGTYNTARGLSIGTLAGAGIGADHLNINWDGTNHVAAINSYSQIAGSYRPINFCTNGGSVSIGSYLKDADSYKLRITGTSFFTAGNMTVSSNVIINGNNGNYLQTDAIRALDSGGLGLQDDSGTLGIHIKDGGYVGIGTTNPDEKLSIHESTAGTDCVLKFTNAQCTAGVKIGINTSDDAVFINYDADADIVFYTGPPDERMRIGAGGDIDIANLGTGAVYSSSGVLTNSDPCRREWKENITLIEDALSKIMELKPSNYNYSYEKLSRGEDYVLSKEDKRLRSGFILDETQAIIPNLCNDNGIYTSEIIPYLVKAIQEQQIIILDLKARMDNYEDSLLLETQEEDIEQIINSSNNMVIEIQGFESDKQ